MKITKQRLSQIIKEELTHQSIGASRPIDEVFKSTSESLMQAHKDLQMLSLHLKNAGSTTQEVEDLVRAVERVTVDLNGQVADDVKNILAADEKAAEEILGTRMGSYKGTTLPGGEKVK